MSRLKSFYNEYPQTVDRFDYMKQVCHTVGGVSISDDHLDEMVSKSSELLELGKDDYLLDLCCGNGYLTKKLAGKCKKVVGIDFSAPLLDIAMADHYADNIEYYNFDVFNLDRLSTITPGRFTKVIMHAALQHFTATDLKTLLENIASVTTPDFIGIISFVPDKQKKWDFHNTIQRKLKYFYWQFTGKDIFGTWWDRKFIKEKCRDLNLTCSFHEVPENLHASIYRFNVKIGKTG